MYVYASKSSRCQLLASLPVIFNELIGGIAYGWVAPTLSHLQYNEVAGLSVDVDQASWIGSLAGSGRMIAPLFSTWLLNLIGRKGVLTMASLAFFISYALIAFTKSVEMIYVSRIIVGLANGLHDVAATIYLGENIDAELRGYLGHLAKACFYGGMLIEYCWMNYFTYDTTAYINMVATFVALFAFFASTETAHYLISKGRHEEAQKNFLWLRGESMTHMEWNEEFQRLKSDIDTDRIMATSIIDDLRIRFYRKSIIIVLVFGLLINATGYEAITSYISVAFTTMPLEYTILFGMCQFILAVLGTAGIEKVNKRTILLIGMVIAALVHTITAFLFYTRDEFNVINSSLWTFATITTYSVIYSSVVYPIFITMKQELLPQRVKFFGCAVSVAGHALVGFCTTKIFLLVDFHWNFAFYAIASMVTVIFAHVVLPETGSGSLKLVSIEDYDSD